MKRLNSSQKGKLLSFYFLVKDERFNLFVHQLYNSQTGIYSARAFHP